MPFRKDLPDMTSSGVTPSSNLQHRTAGWDHKLTVIEDLQLLIPIMSQSVPTHQYSHQPSPFKKARRDGQTTVTRSEY